MEREKVPLKHMVIYALPAFSLAVVGIPLYVYIPKFYTDVVGVNIAVIGVILLVVRLFDAVSDPVIGFMSDRTGSAMGRRRPYLAAGSLFIAVSLYFLFNPMHFSPAGNTVWFGIWIFLVFLFWTVITVPYEALGPEISFDYNERTTLFAFRDGALIAGTLVAASSPLMIKKLFGLPETGAGEREKFFLISVIYIPLILLALWLCISVIKEKKARLYKRESVFRELRSIFANRPFVILLSAYTISAIGNNLPATLILYYVQYVLGSSHADLFLLMYFVSGILFLPVWAKISAKAGKKAAWLAAMAVNTGAFLGVFFLGRGDAALYGVLVVLSGVGFGAALAIPSSIQADVIDYGELQNGSRNEGQYIGIWSISKKLAAAVGIGVGLAILGKAGYVPNREQGPEVIFTLKVLYALVPCIFNFIAIIIAMAYPITGEMYEDIREKINERQSKENNTVMTGGTDE